MGSCFSVPFKAHSSRKTGGDDTGRRSTANNGSAMEESVEGSKETQASVSITPRSEVEILTSSKLKSFSFAELQTATRNFRRDSVVGVGGFGLVFKGWIDGNTLAATKPGTGIVIAVKQLNTEGQQGHKEWLAEVNYLGQLCHPNLVKLIGYCSQHHHRLLVYEFMLLGSLENHLFRREFLNLSRISPCAINQIFLFLMFLGGSFFGTLSWNFRIKIALDAAKGLAFLHSDEIKIIYRDFKASNILLDSNYNAKISDFGLAKDGPNGDKSYVSTQVMGTIGYAAPEYVATGHLTAKSDVYSFGVVLLELLSGRRAVDPTKPPSEQKLVQWATPFLTSKHKLYQIVDKRLELKHLKLTAWRVARLTASCLSPHPKLRPSMEQTVILLEKISTFLSKME